MTFQDIVTEVKDRLNLSSTESTARVGRAVNARYRRVTSSMNLQASRHTSVAQLTVVDSAELTLTGIEKVERVFITSTNVVLEEELYDVLRNTAPGSGTPTKFGIKRMDAGSVTIYLNTIPATPLSLTIDGLEQAITLSGTQVPKFAESFHDILVEGALADEYKKLEKPQLAQMAEETFERRLSDLRMFIAKSGYLDIYQGKTAKTTTLRTTSSSSGGGGGITLPISSDSVTFLQRGTGSVSRTLSNKLYEDLSVTDFGAIGDGVTDDTAAWQACITAARTYNTGVIVPPLIYKISAELDIHGVSVQGQYAGETVEGGTAGPDWPTIQPASGFSRLFRVGPTSAAAVTAGYVDRAVLSRLRIDLTHADTNFVAVGSQYGVAFRQFSEMHIRGVSGQVASKAFAAFKLNGTSESTNISAYNTFMGIEVHDCADAFNLIADGLQRYDETTFDRCRIWGCLRGFSIIGIDTMFLNCGVLDISADWNPTTPTGTSWMIKAPISPLVDGGSNTIVNFALDNIVGWQRPFFFLSERTMLSSLRQEELYSYPARNSGGGLGHGAPDVVQWTDNAGLAVGPQISHGGVHIRQKSVLAGALASAQVGRNLLRNNAFWDWEFGTSFSTPANTANVVRGFTAVKNSTSYTFDRDLTVTLKEPQSLKLVVNNNTGITGFQADASAGIGLNALQGLGDVCVGMIVWVSAAQATLDGVYVGVDDGRQTVFSDTYVLKYDGTRSWNTLTQQAGQWHVCFVNMPVAANATQLLCTFGLNNDGSHAGTGTMYIDSVFCYQGYRDAYTAWNPVDLQAYHPNPSLKAQLSATASWTPGVIANGAAGAKTVTLYGLRSGDVLMSSFSLALGNGVGITANWSADDTANVAILNNSGAGINLGSGTVRVYAFKQSSVN